MQSRRPSILKRQGLMIALVVAVCGILALVFLTSGNGRQRTSRFDGMKSRTYINETIFAAIYWSTKVAEDTESAQFSMPIDILVSEELIPRELLDSPVGEAPDGGEDYWILPDRIDPNVVSYSNRFVVMYDRVMYSSRDKVAVGYLDGKAEVLDLNQFEQLIASPPNDGRDFDLPQRSE